MSQKVEGCLLPLKGKHHSNAKLPKDKYIGNHCEMADSSPPPGVVYSICITDVWAAGGKSISCVNRLLTNFAQFLPRPKQQRIGTHRCLPPLWCCTDVRCLVHLCKVIQCSCIIGQLPVGGWLPGPEDYVATACITGWLP